MHSTLAQRAIEILSSGPVEKQKLLETLEKERGVTPQAVYKALRQLKKGEAITTHKSMVSLSIVWIQKEFDRVSQTAAVYQAPVYQTYFGGLKSGQKSIYKFKTLKELDLFWTHAVLLSVQGRYREAPVISLAPHDWFELLRPSTAEVWDKISGSNNPHFAVMTHSTAEEKKKSKHPNVKKFERMFNANPLKQKESVYLNIVGDLIFEARLDTKVLPDIRDVMADKPVNIDKVFHTRGKFQLAVENNPKKALAVKKRLQKYFVGRLY